MKNSRDSVKGKVRDYVNDINVYNVYEAKSLFHAKYPMMSQTEVFVFVFEDHVESSFLYKRGVNFHLAQKCIHLRNVKRLKSCSLGPRLFRKKIA